MLISSPVISFFMGCWPRSCTKNIDYGLNFAYIYCGDQGTKSKE